MGSMNYYFHISVRGLYNGALRGITSRSIKPRHQCFCTRTRSNMEAEKLVVNHDKDQCEFYIQMPKDSASTPLKALLEYNWVDKNIIDMHHTEVPVEFRGKGVAKLLAKDALDFAVKEDLKFYLTCTYLQKYVNDNPQPEYTKRIVHS